MKREERADILAKLSCVLPILPPFFSPKPHETLRKSQAELAGLNLKSSATLGTGRISSHKEILDRREDKAVRRISKANLDPMIDEDTDDEEYHHSPLVDLTKPFRTSSEEYTRRSGTSDVHSLAGDDEVAPVTATLGLTATAVTFPASVGSALRKNADGNVAVPKVLPKRIKGLKVNKTNPAIPNHWLTVLSSSATKLGEEGNGADTPSGRI